MPVKLVVIVGARPNFVKVGALFAALTPDEAFATSLVHTGQHFDEAMSGQFFRDLGLPKPHYHLEVGGGTHAQQTAAVMTRLEPVLGECKPHGVIVVGDVNSTVAAALVASKTNVEVVHVEAGLRSFDRTMPEEINRIVTDSISDVLLVTEESGRINLLREGVPAEKIHMVGNLMIDSLRRHLPRALLSDIRERVGVAGECYGLITLHRPANVDEPERLARMLEALRIISEDLLLLWPVHPRTRLCLEKGNVTLPERIRLLKPLGYLDFLALQATSAVVLTDSGGIQEETTILNVPCLTLRENTERPVTIEYGTNRLAGTQPDTILAAWRDLRQTPRQGRTPPLWDGLAGERCRLVLREHFLAKARSSRK